MIGYENATLYFLENKGKNRGLPQHQKATLFAQNHSVDVVTWHRSLGHTPLSRMKQMQTENTSIVDVD